MADVVCVYVCGVEHKQASVVTSSPPNVRGMFEVMKGSQNPVVLEQLLEALHRLHLHTDRVLLQAPSPSISAPEYYNAFLSLS